MWIQAMNSMARNREDKCFVDEQILLFPFPNDFATLISYLHRLACLYPLLFILFQNIVLSYMKSVSW